MSRVRVAKSQCSILDGLPNCGHTPHPEGKSLEKTAVSDLSHLVVSSVKTNTARLRLDGFLQNVSQSCALGRIQGRKDPEGGKKSSRSLSYFSSFYK